jgi:uncharacterized protein (DUF58 family)
MKPDDEADIQTIFKKVRRIELKTRGLVTGGIAGKYHSSFKGEGLDFEDLREYQHGDEVRAIDWNVTARMGTPFLKNFAEEREMSVFLIVDVSDSMNFGSVDLSKRELAAEIAAVFAFSAIQNRDKVGLILFSGDVNLCLPPRRGAGQGLRIIREILHQGSGPVVTSATQAMRSLTNVARRRALVILISDFLFELRSETVRSACARHDLVAVQVSDPAERELPNAGWLRFRDPETGQHRDIDTGDRALREAYAKERLRWQGDVDVFFRRHAVDLIKVSTEANYLPAMHSFFRRRVAVQN